MAMCINKNSVEYQSLKNRAGIPEFILEAISRDFMEKYGRLPYLDELPNSNSEPYLRDLLGITKYNSAKIESILEMTGKDTVEEAVVDINNQFRDLEMTIVPINKEALVDIVHRPTENNFDNWTEEDEILAQAPRDNNGNLLAPNGKISNLTELQYVLVRTKAFKKWFGDWENNPSEASKVVDENGEPKVMYHYTTDNFNTFNINYFGQTDQGDHGRGFYFSFVSPDEDSGYFKEVYGNIAMPVFLNIKNPINTKDNKNTKYFNRIELPYQSHREQLQHDIDVQEYVKKDLEEKLYGDNEEYIKFKNPEYIGTIVETSRLEQVNKKINKLKDELNNLKEDYDENKEYNDKIKDLNKYDGVINGNFEIVVPTANQIKSATSNSGSFNRLSRNIYDPEPNGYLVLNNALQKLASLYGITFNEISDAELNSERWQGVIPDGSLVNAFIYNGQIYINLDRANLDAPIHEMFHMFVGSLRFTNPSLYQSLIESVQSLSNYDRLVQEYPGRTRNDVNEEIFVTEISKYLTGQPSSLAKMDSKTRYEISYNIKRMLDTILMGLDSVKTISEDRLFNLSLKEIAQEVNSAVMVNNFTGTMNVKGSELHRRLNNVKSDLYKEGTLKEYCD